MSTADSCRKKKKNRKIEHGKWISHEWIWFHSKIKFMHSHTWHEFVSILFNWKSTQEINYFLQTFRLAAQFCIWFFHAGKKVHRERAIDFDWRFSWLTKNARNPYYRKPFGIFFECTISSINDYCLPWCWLTCDSIDPTDTFSRHNINALEMQ